MLPALVSLDGFLARVPGGVSVDSARAAALLEDASALARAEAGVTWTDETTGVVTGLPDVVASVVMNAARRAYVNPDMLQSESVAGWSGSYSSSSPDVYLTKGERSIIRRAVGKSGLWSQSVTRLDVGELDVPGLHPAYVDTSVGAPEEVDPFAEGWPG